VDKEASMELIQLDIARTFPHLCIFQRVSIFIYYAVFLYPEHSSVMECTQPQKIFGGKAWPASKADNLTTICEVIV
jgi:hypothetical protein